MKHGICKTKGDMGQPAKKLEIQEKSSRQRLCENQDYIIQQFVQRVRQEIPAISSESQLVLADSIPELISYICERFSSPGDGSALQGIDKVAKVHAKSRARISGYNVNRVLIEYHILRRVIVDFLIQSGGMMDFERTTVNEAIDRGIADAGQAFLDIWREQHQEIIDRLSAESLLRERFVYALTHDLCTPITTARLSTELALKHVGTDTGLVTKSLGNALGALERMNQMVEDLLNVGRSQADRGFPVTLHQINLKHLVQETIDELEIRFGKRFHLEDIDIYIPCDSFSMRRAIENLLINADKYGAPQTSITVTLQDLGDRAKLSVFNQGEPISTATRETMFEPFRRGPEESTEKKVGWGMGLYLVKSVVEAHHGNIEVESSKEIGGTRFSLYLPKGPA